jgi:hypothetical protein
MIKLFKIWMPHFIHTKVPKSKLGRKPLNKYVLNNKEYVLMDCRSDDKWYYCDYFTVDIN